MPINLHLILSIAAIFGAGCAGLLFGGNVLGIGSGGIVSIVTAMICALVGAVLAMIIFQKLIPARCPNGECKKVNSFLKGFSPVTYACKSCGHEHVTNIRIEGA